MTLHRQSRRMTNVNRPTHPATRPAIDQGLGHVGRGQHSKVGLIQFQLISHDVTLL